MLPTEPHHAVSAAYRMPGGLRALDFYLEKISEDAGERDTQAYNVGVIGPRAADVALPLAAMGFNVTAHFASETDMEAARQTAQDVGVEVKFKVGSAITDGPYDALVVFDGWIVHDDFLQGLSDLHAGLKPDGLLLMSVARKSPAAKWRRAEVVGHLRQAGWLPLCSKNSSAVLATAMDSGMRPAIRRSRQKSFHGLDALDGHLAEAWPAAWSGGWLFACRASNGLSLIVQIIPTFSYAGAEHIALALADGLRQQGFQTLTVANVAGGPLEKEFVGRGLRHLVLGRTGALGRWTSFVRLRRLLADTAPEVVQTHLFGADLWGRLAARSAGIKNIVTTEHNVKAHFGAVGRLVLTAMARFSTRYVAISQEVADFLRDLSVPADRIRLIPNGVDLKRVALRPAQPTHDVPRLLFLGRLEAQKDPATALRALSQISRPWQLTVVGDGSLEVSLRKLSEELGIASRIRWLGARDDAARIYAQHDLFLLPSIYEGFGLVAIEAAVAGLPIIASDLPVLKKLLGQEGATFAPPGNADAWTEAIEKFLNQPEVAVERAQKLASQDWTRYDVATMAKGYAGVYHELIEKL